ncbi:MAG: protein kinase [Archangium sp.]|nr:protein kinase [Archangium sp.]
MANADPIVGSTLGSFKISRVIGRGGMGTVYLGEHAIIGSRVAIKVLQEKLASDEGLVARFYAEARAVNLIGHENIVNIFDMNVVPPHRYYLVMEYLEGKPLNYLMTQPVPAAISIPILQQVCDALQAAHEAGIVHRDLKPENIFLIKRGKQENFVKVLDFGLAKLLDTHRSSTQTAAGLIVGTPEFMSPEQANSAPVDGRSDIYSLGCIAWLLATGRLPFPQRGLADLLVAHRSQNPRPAHEEVQSVPRAWGLAIQKAMSKDPNERFQTANDFANALDEALKTGHTSSPSRTRIPTPFQGRTASPVAPAGPPPPQPRHTARFDAVVSKIDGTTIGTMQCTDISKGGMFLSTSGGLPVVFSKVKIKIPSAGNLELLAEVVRHVPADQAKAWGMSPGFGVQFIDVTPALRDDLNRLVQGLPLQPKVTEAPRDQTVDALLGKYRDRMNGDHYILLSIPPTSEMDAIAQRCTEVNGQLSALLKKNLKPNETAQLEATLARVRTAKEALSAPLARARYDAHRGNWKGIARCITGGLGPLDLERLRQEFLVEHPSAAGSAHVKLLASKGYEQNGQLKEAFDACENALQIDPLNLQLHQRHAALKRALGA